MSELLRHPEHEDLCWLNADQITVPCWCNCSVGKENRIKELTELLIERKAWDIFWYSQRLLAGERQEVNRRISKYIEAKNKEGW